MCSRDCVIAIALEVVDLLRVGQAEDAAHAGLGVGVGDLAVGEQLDLLQLLLGRHLRDQPVDPLLDRPPGRRARWRHGLRGGGWITDGRCAAGQDVAPSQAACHQRTGDHRCAHDSLHGLPPRMTPELIAPSDSDHWSPFPVTDVTNPTTGQRHTSDMPLLDSWTSGEPHLGRRHPPDLPQGQGPGVIVIHEIPGLTPEVIAFAEEVVAPGFTVVMPHAVRHARTTRCRRLRREGRCPSSASADEFTTLARADHADRRRGCARWPATCTASSAGRASARSGCASPAASRWR